MRPLIILLSVCATASATVIATCNRDNCLREVIGRRLRIFDESRFLLHIQRAASRPEPHPRIARRSFLLHSHRQLRKIPHPQRSSSFLGLKSCLQHHYCNSTHRNFDLGTATFQHSVSYSPPRCRPGRCSHLSRTPSSRNANAHSNLCLRLRRSICFLQRLLLHRRDPQDHDCTRSIDHHNPSGGNRHGMRKPRSNLLPAAVRLQFRPERRPLRRHLRANRHRRRPDHRLQRRRPRRSRLLLHHVRFLPGHDSARPFWIHFQQPEFRPLTLPGPGIASG